MATTTSRNGNNCTVKHATLLAIMVTIIVVLLTAMFNFTNADTKDFEVRLREVEGTSIAVNVKLQNIQTMLADVHKFMKEHR